MPWAEPTAAWPLRSFALLLLIPSRFLWATATTTTTTATLPPSNKLRDGPTAHAACPSSSRRSLQSFANLRNPPAGQDPPLHHLDHTRTKNSRNFPWPTHPTSPNERGTQIPMADMLERESICPTSQARLQRHRDRAGRFNPRIVGTGGLRDTPPPRVHQFTLAFRGVDSFRYGDCSLRIHSRHAVSIRW